MRLPTGEDELAVLALPPEVALNTLETRSIHFRSPQTFTQHDIGDRYFLKSVAPLISGNLTAVCPECRHEQEFHFDMQTYLLTYMKSQQQRVFSEIHTLALTYHCGLDEILALPRLQRHQIIRLIEAYASRSSRRAAGTPHRGLL